MRKFPDSSRLLLETGVLQPDSVIDPGLVADIDLLRVHTAEYVESIRTGRFNAVTGQRLGLPPSDALSLRSHCAVAGTLAAARAALTDGLSANLAGGTHHAFADRGEGFCVFNDVAVAVRALQADEPLIHAAVVDLDAHQGNGTHHLLRGDRRTFTYSMHVGRNYPSVKEPGDLDVELPRFVSGAEYLDRLYATLPGALESFEPDIAFYIAGVDVHVDDRFGQMRLGTVDMANRDRWTINLLRDWGIPTVVLYGGGYNKIDGITTALHCQSIAIAAERFAAERRADGYAESQ